MKEVDAFKVSFDDGLEVVIIMNENGIRMSPMEEGMLFTPARRQYLLSLGFVAQTYENLGIVSDLSEYLRVAHLMCDGVNSGDIPEFRPIQNLSMKEFDDEMKPYDGRGY